MGKRTFILLFSATCSLAVACTDADSSTSAGGGGTGGAGGITGTAGSTGGTGGTGGSTGGSTSTGGSIDIQSAIEAIPGVLSVAEAGTGSFGYRYFIIDFDQPVDHNDPGGQHFTQRLTLHHRDTAAPLVLAATGYWLFGEYLEEPTALLSANQIFVEQRYFSPSRPEPADWSFLNIQQAAADHHAIVEAFKPLYSAKWISTGASKGGMTSVYHRRFYPGDVDGTVAYVAPHSFGLDDPRYVTFLDSVGTAACRQKLDDLERELLLRRPAMLSRMQAGAAQSGLTFDLLGFEASFEGSVTSLSFAFWQYQDESLCDGVPGAGSSDDEVYSFFDSVALPLFSADEYVLGFEPYYWQAYTQLGTPGIDTTHLDDLLTVDWTMIDEMPSVPVDPVFDPAAMQDVSTWLTSEGSQLLFIYGQNDPWTAAQFDLGGATESWKLFQAGGNHGSSILGLSSGDQQIALDALQAWTGVMPQPPPAPIAQRPRVPLVRFFRRK